MCDPTTIIVGAKMVGSALANTGVAAAATAAAAAPTVASVALPAATAYTYERGRKKASQAQDQMQQAAQEAANKADPSHADYVAPPVPGDSDGNGVPDYIDAEQERAAAREAEEEKRREAERIREQQRQQNIAQGRSNVGSAFESIFTDPFYQEQEQAYMDFANPQLEDQYKRAGRDVLMSMARTGNLQSSARNERQAALEDRYVGARQGISDEAARRVADLQNRVALRKEGLMQQAETAENPTLMGNLAQGAAASLQTPEPFNPLGDVFANALAGLTTAFEAEQRRRYDDDYLNALSGLSTTGKGQSKVVS